MKTVEAESINPTMIINKLNEMDDDIAIMKENKNCWERRWYMKVLYKKMNKAHVNN